MVRKNNHFDNDFDDVEDIGSFLKEIEMGLPDEDDAFFDIELESLETYLENSNRPKNGSK